MIPEATLALLRAGIYDLRGIPTRRERDRVAAMVRERRKEDEMGFPEACRTVARVLDAEPQVPDEPDAPENDPWSSPAERFW